MTGQLELQLLDGFELRDCDQAIAMPAPAQRLIAALALNVRPLSRPYIAGLLWPTATKERSMASLRSALRPCAPQVIVKSRTHLRLREHVTVDYRRSLTVAHAALTGDFPRGATMAALGLLTGDLLPDMPDDWLEPFRLHHRQLRLKALDALSDRLLDEGRPHLASYAAMIAVVAEPLRETAQLRLIRAMLAEGNRAQALRHYREFRAVLRAELGIDPSFSFNDAGLPLAITGGGGACAGVTRLVVVKPRAPVARA